MDDTICAIATASGMGAISIIRLSGSEALSIIKKIFDRDLDNVKSHTIHYGHIIYNGEIIDEVLINIMLAPKTYTREDTVEINCHGGYNSTKKILEVLLAHNARLAEPGEFTKRAYLNGRINLVEAESVNDLIVAKTDAARKLALNNMGGKLTQKIKNIREKIAKILANIEVNIDYPEYVDELVVTEDLMNEYINDIIGNLKELVDGFKIGRLIKEGVNIAIIGKPNVGKSSILNSLLDEQKAIVTDIPGTTRDIVEGSITLNGIALNFIDTAGIRSTDDIVEQIGVDKSRKMAEEADLILLVLNNNEELNQEEKDLLQKYDSPKTIIFVNKNDLPQKINIEKTYKSQIIWGNTIESKGLDRLLEAISNLLNLEDIMSKEMSYLTNLREKDLVNKACESLKVSLESLNKNMPVDIIEMDLKKAWEYLGELIGESYQDELVDEIFSRFCLGK